MSRLFFFGHEAKEIESALSFGVNVDMFSRCFYSNPGFKKIKKNLCFLITQTVLRVLCSILFKNIYFFYMKDSCFMELSWFLPNINMNQP